MRRFLACVAVLGLAGCNREKRDFESMKATVDPIAHDFAPLDAKLDRAVTLGATGGKDGGIAMLDAMATSLGDMREVCEKAQHAAFRANFDAHLYATKPATDVALDFELALGALTTLSVSATNESIELEDVKGCVAAFDKLCAAGKALSAAAKAAGVSIDEVCK
jgi:hypothetical protein